MLHTRLNSAPNYCQFVAAGGLVGRIDSADVKVSYCYAYAIDMNDGYSTDNAGLIGWMTVPATVDGCYSTVSLVKCTTGNDVNVTNSYFVDDGHWAEEGALFAGTEVTADELTASAAKDNLYFVVDEDVNGGSPALAWECGFDVISNATVTEGNVTQVTVEKWNETSGRLMIAAYDSNGNLANVKLFDTVSASDDYTVDFEIGDAAEVKVFLWNLDTIEALSKARKL